MSAPLWLAVGVLGGIGAVARFLLDGAVARRVGGAFPLGILAVNLSGAFALGVLAGARARRRRLHAPRRRAARRLHDVQHVGRPTATGCGARAGAALAAANLAGSLALGLAAVWLGRTAGLRL